MRDLFGIDRAFTQLRGNAECHCASRDLHTSRHQRTRTDERTAAYECTVQHDRPSADEGTVFDNAPLEMGEVTDGAIRADDGLEGSGAVDHGTVLDRRPRTDDDAALITAQNGLRPDRRAGADFDVADDRAF